MLGCMFVTMHVSVCSVHTHVRSECMFAKRDHLACVRLHVLVILCRMCVCVTVTGSPISEASSGLRNCSFMSK